MQRAFVQRQFYRRLARTLCTNSTPKSTAQSPITWRTVALFGAAGTCGLAYYSREKQRRMEEITRPRAIGKAAIGGPFQLLDGTGQTVTHESLHGRWTLIYFGFTMCPDICPEELTKVGEALAVLEKKGRTVSPSNDGVLTPVFISIDPERDSPARAAEYAKAFHPAFVGLSGSLEQVTKAAKAFRVYFSKGEGEEYLVDHSIITYLMDPNGNFSEFYGKNCSSTEMAARIEARMLAWKP